MIRLLILVERLFRAAAEMIARANDLGMAQEIQEDVSCCYAVQDKTWVKGPENDWEIYYVKGDAPSMSCSTGATATGWATDIPTAPEDAVVQAGPPKACCS